jgi:alpha-ketoglutarate-dependent taurine dioxygenase
MLIAAQAREVCKDEQIERLEKLVAAFKKAALGSKLEKADPEQFDAERDTGRRSPSSSAESSEVHGHHTRSKLRASSGVPSSHSRIQYRNQEDRQPTHHRRSRRR